MKYPVVKAFLDRLTHTPHNEGGTYETEDGERVKELAAGGYILLPKGQPKPQKETPPQEEGKAQEVVSESDTKPEQGKKKIPVKKNSAKNQGE